MICHVRRYSKIYKDLCVYRNPCPRFCSTIIIRHPSLSDKFEEISSLKNFGEVQRNVCWLFDLELAIIGSGYLLLALSRHPDLLSCAGGWGHVFF